MFCRKHFLCTCGKQFPGNASTDEMAAHVRSDRPHTTKIARLMLVTAGFDPKTAEEIEAEFGVPASMIELDPPFEGRYYTSYPVWRKWEPIKC